MVRSALAMDAEYVRLVMKDVVELREMNYQLREVGVWRLCYVDPCGHFGEDRAAALCGA